MSLNQFLAEYGTEQQCEAILEQSRWPQGFQCPECMDKDHFSYFRGRVKVFPFPSFRSTEDVNQRTIIFYSKLPLPTTFQAICFLRERENNVSILELGRLTGLSYPATWRMKHKLMQVMYARESTTKLSGRVEIDDAYLGGENPGGKAGRDSENKIPFIAAVQTNNQNNPLYVVFSKVKTFSREEITAWATRSLVSSATVVSDGLWCFKGVTDIGCVKQ